MLLSTTPPAATQSAVYLWKRPAVRQPVQHFAVWHHLRRIRAKSAAGESTRGPVHAAKQQVSESIKFLLWLNETHQRTAASCTQQDIDEWLSAGTTTRSHIRTFFMVAAKSRLNTTVTVQHRPAKTSPSLSQDQRIAWIHELLTGTSESLTYRVAGTLLLLYAQPLVSHSSRSSPSQTLSLTTATPA